MLLSQIGDLEAVSRLWLSKLLVYVGCVSCLAVSDGVSQACIASAAVKSASVLCTVTAHCASAIIVFKFRRRHSIVVGDSE